MKYPIKYSACLLVILFLSSCLNNTTKEVLYTEYNAFGLFPTGNDEYSILASKAVEIEHTWETDDSLLFLKIDTSGNLISKQANPTLEKPSIRYLYLLNNGNILFYGSLNQYYSGEYSAYEYTPNGQIDWEFDLENRSYGMAPADDDNIFVFGWEYTERIEGKSNYDNVTYAKLSTAGDTIWAKSLKSDSYSTRLTTGALTADNGCVAAGTKYISERGSEIWALRFDAQGDTLWSKTYGGNRYDDIQSVNILSDNSILLVGSLSVYDTTNFDYSLNSGKQTYLVKLDANGNKLWTKAIGKTLREEVFSFIEGKDGSLIICGQTETSYAYIFDVPVGWVSKLDANGNKIWLSEFDFKIPIGIRELNNGDILTIANYYDEDNYYKSLHVLKLSSEGTLLSSTTLIP